jgi:hypothetical protein
MIYYCCFQILQHCHIFERFIGPYIFLMTVISFRIQEKHRTSNPLPNFQPAFQLPSRSPTSNPLPNFHPAPQLPTRSPTSIPLSNLQPTPQVPSHSPSSRYNYAVTSQKQKQFDEQITAGSCRARYRSLSTIPYVLLFVALYFVCRKACVIFCCAYCLHLDTLKLNKIDTEPRNDGDQTACSAFSVLNAEFHHRKLIRYARWPTLMIFTYVG